VITVPRRGPSPTPFGELYNRDEDRRRFDDRRDTGREDSEQDFRQREQSRNDDRRDIEQMLRNNDIQVDDMVSLAVEVLVDQYRDGIPIGEKTLQKVLGKKLGTGFIAALNPIGTSAANIGRTGFGSGRFQKQFGQNMGFNFSQLSKPKKPRSKKAKAGDKKLSAAFKKANAASRKKNGQLKKGKTQADVARMAHRLLKKM